MAVKSNLFNMVLCLGIITLVCAALLAGVYIVTEEPISLAAKAKTEKAMSRVAPHFEQLETAQDTDGNQYVVALDAEGNTLAYIVNASSVGFGGPLRLMVGFRPDGTIYNTSVLEHSETPGLGAKCADTTATSFAFQFKGFEPSIKKLSVKQDGGDVDAITASTITSRAYCAALANAVAIFEKIAVKPAPDSLVFSSDSLLVNSADSLSAVSETIKMEGNENE